MILRPTVRRRSASEQRPRWPGTRRSRTATTSMRLPLARVKRIIVTTPLLPDISRIIDAGPGRCTDSRWGVG